jgi:uncharacterized protein (DUF58 family)
MFPREVEFADVARVLVLPRIVRLLGVGEGGDRYPGEGSGQGAWREYPPESVGVREHQPGEALGRVHWPTTLRVGRLMVRQFDQPFASDVWIVLDLEARSNWGAEEHSTLEYGVTLAASLASEFISRGRRVGLLASDRACSVVEPQGGVRHLVELMEMLALVEADGDRPLAEVLSWRRWQGAGEGLAVVTASSAPEWVSLLVERARRGSAPLVFHLDAPSFDPRGRSVLLPADLSVDVRTIRCGDDLERSSGRRGVEPIAV